MNICPAQAIAMDSSACRAWRRPLGIATAFTVVTVGAPTRKGSCCAMLECDTAARGYPASALYLAARCCVITNACALAAEKHPMGYLCAAFERIEAAAATRSLTYFEFGTLGGGGHACIRDAQVEVAILEVDWAGRLMPSTR